ncbi:WD40 repeat-like protein [Wallemia mellicola]|nr:WD40 repeat-like protein [Wallemia mellicola]
MTIKKRAVNLYTISKSWYALATDNLVYKHLFAQFGWKLSSEVKNTPPPTPLYTPPSLSPCISRSNSFNRQAFSNAISTRFTQLTSQKNDDDDDSLDWLELFKARLELENRWFGKGTPEMHFLDGHTDSVYTVAFDNEKIISGSRDKSIRIWDVKTRALLNTIPDAHNGSVISVKFQSTFGVSAGSDGRLLIWNFGTGRQLGKAKVVKVLENHTAGVLDADFNNNYIASCSKDSSICVYSRKSLKLLYRIDNAHEASVNSLSITKSNVLASAGGDKVINIWNLDKGVLSRKIEKTHSRGIACIDIDNEIIASGSSDNTIQLSTTDGQLLCSLAGHQGLVRSLQIDSSRRIVVSGSYDRCVKVWNLNEINGDVQYARKFDQHESLIFDLDFDSRRIVTASHDKQIMIVDFSVDIPHADLFA